jgi:hypothetical protein
VKLGRLIQAGSEILVSVINKHINSTSIEQELHDQRKKSVISPVHKKGDETDYSNHHWLSLLSASYNILSNILFSRLSPCIDEIIGGHQCGFRHNVSTADQIFCSHQILKKKWEYNEIVHQLFIDIKKAHDSLRKELLYNILIEFVLPMKLARLIKIV